MSLPFADAFAGRSVFVTGHTGFKGSWLALWLHELGAKVTGYALAPPSQPSNFVAARVAELLASHHEADLRDRVALTAALREAKPDVVLHLAARTIVRESYLDPEGTFSVNVQGTALLLGVVRELGRPCAVVVVSSDKCYENDESGRRFREDDRLGGWDPYSASKAAVELVVASYRRSFFAPSPDGVAVASARAGNVIGGGDWTADGIIADTVRALQEDKPVALRNPRAIRPWQHVLEPLSGYLTLAAALSGSAAARFCDAWNFGPRADDEATVQQLVEQFLGVWGGGTWKDRGDPGDPHEAGVLRLATDKAEAELGWRSRWSVAEGVERTARWYRRFSLDPAAARAACLEDIAAYAEA